MPIPDLPSDEALLGELRTLEHHLPGGHDGLTAFVRLARSEASPAELSELLQAHGLENWLVLPLGNAYPALTALKDRIEALTFQKDHDSMTGLRNRRAFERDLALEVERAGRFKTPLSLCMLDLDRFKAVNDTYGHPCGDRVIQAMASILLQETRKIDVAARIGGEEFALILPGTGLLRAQKMLERILEATRNKEVECDGRVLHFTCSMGLASYRGKQIPDAERLVSEADKALYRAKDLGRDRIEAAPLLDLPQRIDETLVQHNEKRFLFSSFFTTDDTPPQG